MNLSQFKDLVSYPFLVGCVVKSWSLTHEAASSNNVFLLKNCN